MKENVTVLANAITGLYLISTESGDRYRVNVRDCFKDYVTDSDGKRKLRNVQGFLVHPSVLFAYIREFLPYVTTAISKVKAAFGKNPADPNIAAYVKLDKDGKPYFDSDTLLSSLLMDSPIKMQLEFHAAGEMQLLDNGREIPHTMDKFNISIVDAEYSPTIASMAKAYEEAEAAKTAKLKADLINCLANLGC